MKKYDCIIVGAGIAGQMVASKLINSGLEICILESGGVQRDDSLDFLNDFKSSGVNFRTDFLNRVRQLGGASNLWAGRLMRLSREDIESRPWLGLNGWPIAYEELQNYYNQVDEMLGILKSWNYIHEFPYDDQLNKNTLENARSVWATKIPRFNESSMLWKKIRNYKKVDIFLNCTVINLEYINSNDVVVNCVFNEEKKIFKAKSVVIASGGIENARILLDSKFSSQLHFYAFNNNIGHYFMDHPTFVTQSIPLIKAFPLTTLSQRSFSDSTIKDGFKFTRKAQAEFELLNPYIEISMHMGKSAENALAKMVALYKSKAVNNYFKISPNDIVNAINTIYLMNPIEKLPHSIRRSYDYIFRKVRRNMIGNGIVFSHHIENSPIYESRIKILDSKNKFGCSEIDIDWRFDDRDLQSSERLSYSIIRLLNKSGLIDNKVQVPKVIRDEINDASHHMGATRMSASKSDGVVDCNLKLWGTDSIYVAGSSVFPSSGHANPTYTIAALSLRLGDYLRNKLIEVQKN